jgi:hypothetical protein
MMLDDGDYELVLGQDQGFSEDPTQAVEKLIEAPNQSSEVSDTPVPNPTQEGKPHAYPSNSKYYNSIIILYILHYV